MLAKKKMWTSLMVHLLLLSVDGLTQAKSAHLPRMVFTNEETAVKSFPLPGQHVPVKIILGQADDVVLVGETDLNFYSFQNPDKTPVEKKVVLKHCGDAVNRDCNYNIAVVQQRDKDDHVFVCGANSKGTECCDINLSENSPSCIPSEKLHPIRKSIEDFVIKKGEHSVLVESEQGSHLYVTYSGVQEYVGIHKFGKDRVRPANHEKEQYYVGLMLSKRRNDSLQDKVYAFYKQKNKDEGFYSEMWLPFVSQVCTSDVGGPKNNLQFSWTSQMKARLFCGNSNSGQYFSELIDVATVHADRWQDTKVYALFRNEWGMSAVCMYTVGDIDHIFTTSPLKGSTTENFIDIPRKCFRDSTKIGADVLRKIEKASEMEQWVQPVSKSNPLLTNDHNYTHIYVDGNSLHAVIYLSLNNGEIHKVLQSENHSFIIAEYRPFNHRAHILGVILHPSSRKLYVNTRSELVQLDVANCSQYGDTCEECVLSRDPYCGWNTHHCSSKTRNAHQDVTQGDPSICLMPHPLKHKSLGSEKHVATIELPSQSMAFLWCPVTSHHATYSWENPQGDAMNCIYTDKHCLIQIDSMGSEQVGNYKCVSEERGFSKVLAQYSLQLSSRAVDWTFSPAVWLCVIAVLSF